MSLTLTTELGAITLRFLPDAAPTTCEFVKKYVGAKLYDGATFYRSDFVIQCGTHGLNRTNPIGDLPVNETNSGTRRSNTRGTASIAHWDVPDCGNTEFFINLQTNAHLDSAYGGYCVFAEVEQSDSTSFQAVDAIAAAIKGGKKSVKITQATIS